MTSIASVKKMHEWEQYEDLRERVKNLHAKGWYNKAIAIELKIPERTVGRWLDEAGLKRNKFSHLARKQLLGDD